MGWVPLRLCFASLEEHEPRQLMEYSDALLARTFVYDGGQCCNSIARHHDRGMIYARQAVFVTAFHTAQMCGRRAEREEQLFVVSETAATDFSQPKRGEIEGLLHSWPSGRRFLSPGFPEAEWHPPKVVFEVSVL